MSRQYKRVLTMYPAWNYQGEIRELNRQSEQGWQLIRGGAFSNKYKKNPDVRYRYQLDYPGKVDDMGRYIETFREQDWEYVTSTFNGWHYFRKPYDPSVPEERYEIFTDQTSLREMLGRWIKLATVLSIVVALFLALYTVALVLIPNLPNLIYVLMFLMQLIFLSLGIRRMKNPSKTRALVRDQALFICFFATLIVGLSCAVYLNAQRHLTINSTADYMAPIPADATVSMEWCDFTIAYTDNYFARLRIEADSPMCFTIMDASGETVYTVTEASMDDSHIKLHLQKGNYRIYFSDFAGGKMVVDFGLN